MAIGGPPPHSRSTNLFHAALPRHSVKRLSSSAFGSRLPGGSKELTKLIHGQTSVANDSAHGKRVHRIVSRNRDDAVAIGHHSVLALANDAEAGFLQSANRVQVINTWNRAHA